MLHQCFRRERRALVSTFNWRGKVQSGLLVPPELLVNHGRDRFDQQNGQPNRE